MTNQSPLTIALIISTGKQDVKLWENPRPADPPLRRDADLIKGRELQAALLQTGAYRLLLPQELREEEEEVQTIELDALDPDAPAIPNLDSKLLLPLCRNKKKGRVLLDREGRLLLRPAKIEHLIPELDEQRRQRKVEITQVLVFATDRMPPEEFEARRSPTDEAVRIHRERHAKEPYAAGEILARWLGARYRLEPPAVEYEPEDTKPIPPACWVNIMQGLASFEGEPDTPDHPLHRVLARRIDNAIHALARASAGYALVSSTGGSCDAKACILASAQLRFPARVYDYPETEEGGHFTPEKLERPRGNIGPTLSLTARAPCATLIRRGDPLGAWGAVAHLMPAAEGEAQPWLPKVRDLARFFRGEARIDALLPETRALAEIPGFGKLLQIACSVEAALEGRAEDRRIAEAVTGIGALVEQALYVILARAIPTLLAGHKLDLANERLTDESGGEISKQARDELLAKIRPYLPANSMCDDLLGKAASKSNVKMSGSNPDCWRHWLCVQQDESWKHAGECLERFEQYRRVPGHGPNLRTLRNHAAHGNLAPGEADQAQELAGRATVRIQEHPLKGRTIEGPLWSLDPVPTDPGSSETAGYGRRFLASPPTRAIFERIGALYACETASDPAVLYACMIHKVLDALHAPIDCC